MSDWLTAWHGTGYVATQTTPYVVRPRFAARHALRRFSPRPEPDNLARGNESMMEEYPWSW